MSDFLTHLAERAVAPFPVVRPRVRSSFEPLAAGEFKFPETSPPPATRETHAPLTAQPRVQLTPKPDHEVVENNAVPPSLPSVVIRETLPAAMPAPARVADGIGRGQDARTTGGAGILPAAFSTPPALHPATGVPGAGTPLPVRST